MVIIEYLHTISVVDTIVFYYLVPFSNLELPTVLHVCARDRMSLCVVLTIPTIPSTRLEPLSNTFQSYRSYVYIY